MCGQPCLTHTHSEGATFHKGDSGKAPLPHRHVSAPFVCSSSKLAGSTLLSPMRQKKNHDSSHASVYPLWWLGSLYCCLARTGTPVPRSPQYSPPHCSNYTGASAHFTGGLRRTLAAACSVSRGPVAWLRRISRHNHTPHTKVEVKGVRGYCSPHTLCIVACCLKPFGLQVYRDCKP